MNNRETRERISGKRISARIVMFYAILGGLWILFSDRLLVALVSDPALLIRLQTVKGWFYVLVTALFLYWLINRGQAEITRGAVVQLESETRFQSLFQAVPVSIWEADLSGVKASLDSLQAQQVKDYGQYFAKRPDYLRQLLQDLKILDVNVTTLEIFAAQSPAELLGALDRVFTPESLPAFRDALKAIAEGRQRFDAEVPVLTLRGECKTILISLTIPSDSEKFVNVPICVMDITVRRRTEEMLRLLESAVRQTRESITITTADLDLPGPTIVFVNPAFTAMTGYAAEEVIGKTPRILHGPKTERNLLEHMKKRLWQRQTFGCETINYRKDGTEFINEWNVAPIIDKNHQVTHFVAVQRDVTERRKAENNLEESHELLEVIFDQAFQLMGLLKPDGTVVKINRKASDFISARDAEVIGKPFWETPWWTHSPEQQERLRAAIETAARGEFVRFEATHQTPEGGLMFVDFSIKPVRDDAGNVVLLVPEGRDVTERKQAEEEINQLNEDLRRRAEELEAVNARFRELGCGA